MYLSQLFVLSSRGDRLVFKVCRRDAPHDAPERLYRRFMKWTVGGSDEDARGDCPPFFREDGVHYCLAVRDSLLFACTTTSRTVSPGALLELLLRIVHVVQDYLGILSEEAIRRNLTLLYELLDEMLEVGVPQEMHTARLRPYIFADVDATDVTSALAVARCSDRDVCTQRSEGTSESVLQGGGERRDELYVDLRERLCAILDADGTVVTASVYGTITLRSFIVSSPTLYLTLKHTTPSADESVQRTSRALVAGKTVALSAILQSVWFDEQVIHSSFSTDGTVALQPTLGTCIPLRYRVTAPIAVALPLRVMHDLRRLSDKQLRLNVRLRAVVPASVTLQAVYVCVALPRCTVKTSATLDADAAGQRTEYVAPTQMWCWHLPRLSGGAEQGCSLSITTTQSLTPVVERQVGPLRLRFHAAQHTATGITISALRVLGEQDDRGRTDVQRWVRMSTESDAYVVRLRLPSAKPQGEC